MAAFFTDWVWAYNWFNRARQTTPPSGDYTISSEDYRLISDNTAAATWTLPAVSGSGRQLKIKNKGAGELTLSGPVFTDTSVSSLILATGDMVTLTDDGTDWSVGD